MGKGIGRLVKNFGIITKKKVIEPWWKNRKKWKREWTNYGKCFPKELQKNNEKVVGKFWKSYFKKNEKFLKNNGNVGEKIK